LAQPELKIWRGVGLKLKLLCLEFIFTLDVDISPIFFGGGERAKSMFGGDWPALVAPMG